MSQNIFVIGMTRKGGSLSLFRDYLEQASRCCLTKALSTISGPML